MSELQNLLGRVKAATGPDRECDWDIQQALFGIEQTDFHGTPRYTASIDAALALTERALPHNGPNIIYSYDLNWNASAREEMAYAAELFVAEGDQPDMTSYHGQAPTLPLAILVALLSAVIGVSGE